MKAVVFTDFDGVLNCASDFSVEKFSMDLTNGYPINQECLDRYRELVVGEDLEIVVSSSWRLSNDKEFFLEKIGGELYDRILDAWRTPSLPGLSKRGDEVKAWLSENGDRPHIILDDDSDFHLSQPLVKTKWAFGLRDTDVEIARFRLHQERLRCSP